MPAVSFGYKMRSETMDGCFISYAHKENVIINCSFTVTEVTLQTCIFWWKRKGTIENTVYYASTQHLAFSRMLACSRFLITSTTTSHSFRSESYGNTAKLIQTTCFKNKTMVSQVQAETSNYLFV